MLTAFTTAQIIMFTVGIVTSRLDYFLFQLLV